MKDYIIVFLMFIVSACASNDKSSSQRVISLGGTPPGKEAIIFSPNLVSVDSTYEFACTFSPDGREFYYTRRPLDGENQIYQTKFTSNGWSIPEKAPFSISPSEYEPHISPDGTKIFWGSARTLPGDSIPPPYPRIWFASRIDETWDDPQLFEQEYMMYVSADLNNNIYFTHIGFMLMDSIDWKYRKPVIARSTFIESIPGAPQVNMPADTALYPGAHPFISPDGSFIIFDSNQRSDSKGATDLYISFKLQDKSWSESINMGETINTVNEDMCASLSPCGNYLMFSRFANGKSDIYWISSAIIEELHSKIMK